MRKFYFGKVIRDKILSAMQEEGCEIDYRKLSGEERQSKLVEKLMEESTEVIGAVGRDDFLEELADVQLVIDALVSGLDTDDRQRFNSIHNSKLDKKGGFSDGIWIETVSVPEGSHWIEYFEAKSEKYPEVEDPQ